MDTRTTAAPTTPRPIDLELERRLRVTEKPVTPFHALPLERPALRLFGRRTHTFYLCGECGVIVGSTRQFTMKLGVVVECPNCGARNEL